MLAALKNKQEVSNYYGNGIGELTGDIGKYVRDMDE